MTPEEFKQLIERRSDRQLLEPLLHDDTTPYVFAPKPRSWIEFRGELARQLAVLPADVRIVGSGRFGFSLRPDRNLKGFSDTSDIDVVVVNSDLFDQLWIALLDAAYPRPPISDKLGGWLQARRNELYTGWLTPLEIRLDIRIFGPKAKPVVDFNTRWFNAFKKASRHPPRRHEDVKGRLYRTWSHAELYHLSSLAALRKSLAQ